MVSSCHELDTQQRDLKLKSQSLETVSTFRIPFISKASLVLNYSTFANPRFAQNNIALLIESQEAIYWALRKYQPPCSCQVLLTVCVCVRVRARACLCVCLIVLLSDMQTLSLTSLWGVTIGGMAGNQRGGSLLCWGRLVMSDV